MRLASRIAFALFCLTFQAIDQLAHAHLSEDPWLAGEKGWIWKVVHAPENLAGSWEVDDLHGGVTYQMTFNATDVEGSIGLFLGDNARVLIDSPGRYAYTFTANDRKRMVFKAVALENGRAKLAADTIRVSVLATDSAYQPEPPSDAWLAIEEGWIWRVVDAPEILAGSTVLSDQQLPGGYLYHMRFNVSAVEGEVSVTLGDNEPVVLTSPGAYDYAFTADTHKRMYFEATGLASGRARLAADTIRVSAAPDPDRGDEGPRVRIAYSADGNSHDADDWSASPLALAMIADEASAGFELVHVDYNNHLGDSQIAMAASHRQIVEEAVSRFGHDASLVFDDQENLEGAVAHLADAINASSADDRLYLVCAGPMEVCWRGIDAAMDSHEAYVSVISHSWWNDNHTDTSELTHTLNDIAADFAVEVLQIPDQNATAFRSPPEDWVWLQQHGLDGQWLYEKITAGGRPAFPGDASDAGMVYYVLTGMQDRSTSASMEDIRALFNN